MALSCRAAIAVGQVNRARASINNIKNLLQRVPRRQRRQIKQNKNSCEPKHMNKTKVQTKNDCYFQHAADSIPSRILIYCDRYCPSDI